MRGYDVTTYREYDIKTIKVFEDFFNVSIDFLLGKTDIKNRFGGAEAFI